MSETLVIPSDFAKRIGVAPALITQKIQRGEFHSYVTTGKTKKIKFEAGIREWIANGWSIKTENPDEELMAIVTKIYEEFQEAHKESNSPHQKTYTEESSSDGIEAISKSRAKREHFEALIKETEYRKLCNKYVEADAISLNLAKIVRNVKFQIQAIPGRISPMLVGKEQRDIEKMLEIEIQQALLDLSGDLAGRLLKKVIDDE